MAGERIPATACHLADLMSTSLGAVVQTTVRDPQQDIPALIEQARQEARAKLRGEDLQAIMGPVDPMTHESFHAAGVLCILAIGAALKHRGVWDRRRSDKTRSWLIGSHASTYILSWSQDRGMDLEEIQRLRQRGGAF